jgi:site-specific DNA recombinase
MWMGGVTPVGYQVQNRKLVIVPKEARTVCLIYKKYRELRSVRVHQQHLDKEGIRSKVRTYRDGRVAGGRPFSRGALYALPSNHVYIGEINHKGIHHPGLQEPDHRTTALQDGPATAPRTGPARSSRPGNGACSPLLGKIFDEAENRLTPSHAVKNRRRHRYYAFRRLVIGTSQDKPDGWRLPAPQIEKLVADKAIRALDHRRFAAGAFDELDSDDGIWEVES